MKHYAMQTGVIALILMLSAPWVMAAGDGHHNSWGPMDTWKVLNFGVLAVALFYLGKKPVVNFFTSRRKSIQEELQELEIKKNDARKKLAEYQERFKNLEAESRQIIAEYIRQGEEARSRILTEAESQANKLEAVAKRNIEQEFKIAKARLQQSVVDMAMEKAESVITDAISAKDQEKLVDDYLKKVVA